MRLQRFEPGQLHQISNIGRGEPVLLAARDLHSKPFRNSDQWFPQVIVSFNQETRVPQAKGSEVAQRLKDIHGIANVAKENVIEFLTRFEDLLELVLIRESDCELEGRISLPR